MKASLKDFFRFRDLPVFWKISFMPILAVGLVMMGMIAYVLPLTQNKFLDDKRSNTTDIVEAAYGLIAEYDQRAASGEFTQEEAKKRASERIRHMKFGQDGYIWISDLQYKMIMHPIMPDLNGKVLLNLTDNNGKYFFQELTDICREKGEGFVEYVWPKSGGPAPAPKISFVKLYRPWGWIIGSGIYVDDAIGTISKLFIAIGFMLVFISIVVTATTFVIGGGFISRPVKEYGKMMQIFSSAMSSGKDDLAGRLNIKGTDEIGLLAMDINKVLDAYGKMVEKRNQAEASLRRSENRLKDIIDFLPDTTFAVDLEGRVMTWNKAAEDYTGVKATEILGRGNQEYSLPFYGERRPMLVDFILNPSEAVEKYYTHVKTEGRVVVGEGYIWGARYGEAYVLTRAVPLVDAQDNVIGAIESIRDITMLKNREETLRDLSEQDALTMIYNRRKLLDMLEGEVEKATRYSRPLSLILLDLDHFKKVNDNFGHHIGDAVLTAMTQIVKDVIRRVDIFGRYGGEEFIVICPETTSSGAMLLAEKIRVKSEQHTHPAAGSVTVSAGVAGLAGKETASDLIKKADDALYAAKKAGRNRVETERTDPHLS